jgi:hypothetical protein
MWNWISRSTQNSAYQNRRYNVVRIESENAKIIHFDPCSYGVRGGDGLGRDNMFLRCGFESRSSSRVGILASGMAYGVVRQGFGPGLQVFLCQQVGSDSSCGPGPLLFTKLDARTAPKWVSDCHA